MKGTMIFCLMCLLYVKLYSQDQTFKSPEIIPPQTAELIKFVDYPVDLSSGLISIEIPLYVIKEGDIEIPLILKYHGSGLKANEPNNRIGLGWSVDFGPSLGRKINNAPDEFNFFNNAGYPTNYNNSDYNVMSLYPYLRYLADGMKDEYPDVFYYKLLSKSGKFMFNRGSSQNFHEPEIVTIPFEPIKITSGEGGYGDFGVFNVWDDTGFYYRFGRSIKNNDVYAYTKSLDGKNTSWGIQEVISPDKVDTVSFNYHTDEFVIITATPTDYISIEEIVELDPNSFYGFDRAQKYYPNVNGLKFPFMTCRHNTNQIEVYNINVSENELIEVVDAANQLSSVYAGLPSQASGSKERQLKNIESKNLLVEIHGFSKNSTNLIQKITIKDKARNKIIKTIEFIHSKFQDNPSSSIYEKWKLDELVFYDENNDPDQKYSFDYYNPEWVPPIQSNNGVDPWGYYTGATHNIPNQNVLCTQYYNNQNAITGEIMIGDGSLNPSSKAYHGSLKSITYPTGRKSTFHYGENQYKTNANTIKSAGGIRIEEIEEYDPLSDSITTRKFKYGYNENGAGNIKQEVTLDDYMIEYYNYGYFDSTLDTAGGGGLYACAGDITKVRIYSSSPFNNMFYQNGAIVFYDYVTEYIDGKGKTEYTYKDPGKTSYRVSGTTMLKEYLIDWGGGQLLQKKEYEYNPTSATYHLKRKEINEYDRTFRPQYVNYGMSYQRMRKRFDGKFPDEKEDFLRYDGLPYETGYATSGCKRLVKNIVRMFFESDSVTQTTSYKYDNPNHMYLTEQTVYANSSPVITTYKYPQDIVFSNAPEEEGRVGLVDNNILSPLLESEKKTNNKGWISKTKYMYKDENRVPKAVSFAEGISLQNLHTKVSVQKFDKKGNPVFYINADMKNTVYIWGYGGHRLVAEIQNATYYDVIGFLGQERIDRLLSSPLPAQSDFDALEALRTQLPKAMVTTIHYQSPILGISSIKSPDEKVTRYEYDGCGRLKETYFFENNDPTRKRVVESYNYNYKNK